MRNRKVGKLGVFTEAQNKALRAALAEADEKIASQKKLGELLGVNQQNAGRLLRSAGFSYKSATRLVQFLGHAGVDAFFAAKGVAIVIEPAVEDTSLHAKAG